MRKSGRAVCQRRCQREWRRICSQNVQPQGVKVSWVGRRVGHCEGAIPSIYPSILYPLSCYHPRSSRPVKSRQSHSAIHRASCLGSVKEAAGQERQSKENERANLGALGAIIREGGAKGKQRTGQFSVLLSNDIDGLLSPLTDSVVDNLGCHSGAIS